MKHSKRRSKEKVVWQYRREKEIRGELVTQWIKTESGDLCKTWPSNFSVTSQLDGYNGNFEYFDYFIHSKPHVKPQPCFHIKNTVFHENLLGYVFNTVATHQCLDGSYRTMKEVCTISGFKGQIFKDGFRLPDIPDLSQSHREALEFFASGCQPLEANWAVNLFEVSEMLNLATQAYKALQLFLKLAKEQMPYTWGMFLRKFAQLDTAAQILWLSQKGSKELADAYLKYSFAILPLLSDIKALKDELDGLTARVAFFRKNNKQPVHVRFRKDLSDSFPTQSVSFPPVPHSNGANGTQLFRTQYNATYVASAMASYDVSSLKDSDIAYRLAKKAFGFSDPLVFLWEKIPFSFVIDWIVDVGGYLASLPSLSTFPYVLSDPVHSLHIEQTNVYTRYDYVPSAYTPRVLRQHVTSTDLIEYYKRQLSIPLTFSGIDTSLPGFEQLKLALALGRNLFRK